MPSKIIYVRKKIIKSKKYKFTVETNKKLFTLFLANKKNEKQKLKEK